MSVLIAIEMYSVLEVCEILAKRKHRHTYDRRQIDDLIKRKLKTAQRIGNRYMLTGAEIDWLETQIRAYKPRQKNIDNRQ